MTQLKIDLITDDPVHDEYVLYLVEDPPWPATKLVERLYALQERVNLAVDAILDGIFAKKFPDSVGRSFRVQVDAYDAPHEVEEVVQKLNLFVQSNSEYADKFHSSIVNNLRIVTGRSLGREQ